MLKRYFIELAYDGTDYSGFQIQNNAVTIQSKVEAAFEVLLKQSVSLTGSSRTDAGVHAYQNYFHFDLDENLSPPNLYNLNAILPQDIVVKKYYEVAPETNARFDATSRTYLYHIHHQKNPFLQNKSWFYPYPVDIDLLNASAVMLQKHSDFKSFCKLNAQSKTTVCTIMVCEWYYEKEMLIFKVQANRFLRGMVRALVATILKVGRQQISLNEFAEIIASKDCTNAFFNAPAHGLFLSKVTYPEGLLKAL